MSNRILVAGWMFLSVGCTPTLESPTPQVESVDPALVCNDQLVTAVTVHGTGLTPVSADVLTDEARLILPELTVQPVTDLLGSSMAGELVALETERWVDSSTMGFDVSPELELPSGIYDVSAANPDGQAATAANALAVVPPPVLDAVSPNLICVDQHDVDVVLTGSAFLVVEGTLPTVAFDDVVLTPTAANGCVDLAGPVEAQQCTELSVTIPQAALATGVHGIVVQNPEPAGCVSTEAVALEVVNPPHLEELAPQLTCVEDQSRDFVLTGSDFLVLADGTLPSLWMGEEEFVATSAEDCTDLLGPAGGQICDSLEVNVPEAALDAGIYDALVRNPEPADCESESLPVELVGAPILTSVVEDLVCDGLSNALTLTGSGFLVVDEVLPTVLIGDVSIPATGADSCEPLAGPVEGERCDVLTLTVPEGTLIAGVQDVVVINPPDADCAAEPLPLVVVDAPVVAELHPETTCYDADTFTLGIEGTGFVFVDGVPPVVEIGGIPLTVTGSSGCSDLGGTAVGESCTQVDVEVPNGTFPQIASHPVVVTNPTPAECESNDDVALEVVDPPEITSVEPEKVCEGGASAAVYGTGFAEGAEVLVGSTPVPTTFVSATEVQIDTTAVEPGIYDLVLTNADGCEDVFPLGLEVVEVPVVLFMDPPVTYSGISVQSTLYVHGVNEDVVSVWLQDANTGVIALDFDWDPSDPNRVLATVPSGLPEGDYSVHITDAVECVAALSDATYVEDDLTVSIGAVDPGFGHTAAYTPVSIYSDPNAPPQSVGFEDVPRLYLNPDAPGPDTTATELFAVTWVDDETLDAVVPPLPATLYDVLVVNPDGTIGLLDKGFEVTAEPPPVVTSVSPASIPNDDDYELLVLGTDFRNPTVEFACEDAASGVVTTLAGTNVTLVDGTELTAVLPATQLGEAVCLAYVTNDDGTETAYASVSVTNPSQNLFGFEAGSSMTTARRAPAVATGRATRTARYLYAIGGDDGNVASAMDSIERAKVDLYGDLAAWSELPGVLPEPRTKAGIARVGRFIYLVGGHDGTAPVNTVFRAQVLDPLVPPRITDLGIEYSDGTAVGGGTWIYRVAALYGATDLSNPGGESLPGNPFVARLPDVPEQLEVELEWTVVPGAVGYRVYRSPVADSGSGTEEWLADVMGETNVSFVDDGGATDASGTPLPAGALGEWAEMPSLPAALEAPCVTVGEDPVDPSVAYLYVAGGRDGAATVRDDIYYYPISLDFEHEQAVSAVATSASSLGVARYECGAVSVTDALHSVVGPGVNWLYFLGGKGQAGSLNPNPVDAALVGAGGEFTNYIPLTSDNMRVSSGYGYAAASNYLYVFGGGSGAPDSAGASTKICSSSSESQCNQAPIDPPDLRNWNAGFSLLENRYLMGSAQESSVIFIVGGQTNSGATDSVEHTNF